MSCETSDPHLTFTQPGPGPELDKSVKLELNACIYVIFLSVCVDVDFLLHIIGFCGIYFIIKNIQENLSRYETKFRRSRTDTLQVRSFVIMSFDWSLVIGLLINHHVL